MVVGDRYLIDTKDKREIRGTVSSVNGSNVTISRNYKEKEVEFSNIRNIGTSKFSTGKTIGLSGIITVSAHLLAVIIAVISTGF